MDHTTAGIELRERFAFAEAEIQSALRQVTDPEYSLLDQAVILSTCNRVELYGVSRSRPPEDALAAFLAHCHGLRTSDLEGLLYVHRDDEVARHVAATAAGLNSLVLGEAQILGQIGKALGHALAAGSAGAELRRLFESAVAAARRVRSETAIGRGTTSVPFAAVELARQRVGTLTQSTVLLIGTGEMAHLAAKQLVRRGTKQVLVLGRTPARARRIADAYGGIGITQARLREALAESDVVISATGTPQPILLREALRQAVTDRDGGSGPLLVIDLSVPRDVDPAATKLAGVEVLTIDDIRGAVECALIRRRAELPIAHAILEREVSRFAIWLSRREVSLAGCVS